MQNVRCEISRLFMSFGKKLNERSFAGRILAAALFCLLFLPLNCLAKTLSEYRDGVKAAGKSVRELTAYVDDVLEEDDSQDTLRERALLAEIRRALPATDRVEWEGSSVETANQWLEAGLKAFEEETKDWNKRRLILNGINERLAALEAKIK